MAFKDKGRRVLETKPVSTPGRVFRLERDRTAGVPCFSLFSRIIFIRDRYSDVCGEGE